MPGLKEAVVVKSGEKEQEKVQVASIRLMHAHADYYARSLMHGRASYYARPCLA